MTNQIRARRKRIITLLSRNVLDGLATVENPWNYDRASLIETIITEWPQAEIENEVVRLVRRAS